MSIIGYAFFAALSTYWRYLSSIRIPHNITMITHGKQPSIDTMLKGEFCINTKGNPNKPKKIPAHVHNLPIALLYARIFFTTIASSSLAQNRTAFFA